MNHKLKKNLRDLVLAASIGGTIVGGAIGWMAWDTYNTNKLKEQYSKLPTIQTTLRPGRGPIDMTGRYVDTDVYTIYVRMPVLEKDNPEYAKDPKWEGMFKVHYDPEYILFKKKKTIHQMDK